VSRDEATLFANGDERRGRFGVNRPGHLSEPRFRGGKPKGSSGSDRYHRSVIAPFQPIADAISIFSVNDHMAGCVG